MAKSTQTTKKKKSPEFPKVIKIGALKWKVNFKPEPGGYKDAWGVTVYETSTIEFVDSWPSLGRMIEVVIHEINHAILNTLSYFKGSTKRPEEDFVTATAAGLAAVLVDNPKLTTWLTWAIEEARKENKA